MLRKSCKLTAKTKVAVIYHYFPHYRRAILRKLAKSDSFNFEFWGGHSEFDGIKVLSSDEYFNINQIKTTLVRGRFRLRGYWRPVLDPQFKALIILGDPNIFATWLAAGVGRILGKKILFWTHGWMRRESFLRAFVRYWYYSLAHKLLVYGERAKTLGVANGFPADHILTIYNSLDWEEAQTYFEHITPNQTAELRASFFQKPDLPLLICVARLTAACRFDLLLEAMSILDKRNMKLNLLFIGDGPQRRLLERMTEKHNLSVKFYGSSYDPAFLSSAVYSADLTVSPGKVGLTAILSLMYGTPVISHCDLDNQMPEVEAIVPGISGALFIPDNTADLARAIEEWISNAIDRPEIRKACRKIIADKFNPQVQKDLIEKALTELFEVQNETRRSHAT